MSLRESIIKEMGRRHIAKSPEEKIQLDILIDQFISEKLEINDCDKIVDALLTVFTTWREGQWYKAAIVKMLKEHKFNLTGKENQALDILLDEFRSVQLIKYSHVEINSVFMMLDYLSQFLRRPSYRESKPIKMLIASVIIAVKNGNMHEEDKVCNADFGKLGLQTEDLDRIVAEYSFWVSRHKFKFCPETLKRIFHYIDSKDIEIIKDVFRSAIGSDPSSAALNQLKVLMDALCDKAVESFSNNTNILYYHPKNLPCGADSRDECDTTPYVRGI